jgi:DNA polymerase III alpha subunit (gram-positive type)
LKFVKNVNILHVLQTVMYYNNLFPDWSQNKNMEIWNLYSGKKYKIKMTKQYTNYDFLKYICDTLSIKMKNNIFVYDLETDGTDFINPEIIERHFVELYLNYVPSSGVVKANVKLDSFITGLTGITNKMLMNGDDPKVLKLDMDMIYRYCEKPTFIAHNGNSFDHRLMMQKGLLSDRLGQFLDSRSIISMVYTKCDLGKKKLEEIYGTITGKTVMDAHRAKCDVDMLVGIFRVLGLELCYFRK